MPEYKLEWVAREYTAYHTYVEGNNPQDALRKFLADPREFDAEDDGFADSPRAGGLTRTLRCTGVCEPERDSPGVSTVRPLNRNIRLKSLKKLPTLF